MTQIITAAGQNQRLSGTKKRQFMSENNGTKCGCVSCQSGSRRDKGGRAAVTLAVAASTAAAPALGDLSPWLRAPEEDRKHKNYTWQEGRKKEERNTLWRRRRSTAKSVHNTNTQ